MHCPETRAERCKNERLGLPDSHSIHLMVNNWSFRLLLRKAAAKSLKQCVECTDIWFLEHEGLYHRRGFIGRSVCTGFPPLPLYLHTMNIRELQPAHHWKVHLFFSAANLL